MNWLYLSPHLDDAIYSCGGLIWEQTHAGSFVEIWTVCAGDPPPGPLSPFAQMHHDRWETGAEAGQVRRAEDRQAAKRIGASVRHLNLPDCIYRRHPVSGEALYASLEAIFGAVHPAEQPVIEWLSELLTEQISRETAVMCPLTLGGHVDHQLVRLAAEKAGLVCRYYADFPYAAREDISAEKRVPIGWKPVVLPISHEGMQAWGDANALYESQMSTFWPDRETLDRELVLYVQRYGGIRYWQKS